MPTDTKNGGSSRLFHTLHVDGVHSLHVDGVLADVVNTRLGGVTPVGVAADGDERRRVDEVLDVRRRRLDAQHRVVVVCTHEKQNELK